MADLAARRRAAIAPSAMPQTEESNSPAARPARRLALTWRGMLVTGCPAAGLALAAVWFAETARYPLWRIQRALEFPYQLDAEEGFVLGQALRLAKGEGLYPPISEAPFVVDNYPPLYTWIWSFFLDTDAPTLAAGRWISALAALAVALAIAVLILCQGFGGRAGPRGERLERGLVGASRLLLAWICGLMFLTSYAALRWMAYARVDLPAVALSVWGLAVFRFWGMRPGGRWGRGLALACFGLALLTKQTSATAPLACLIWLAWRDRRGAARFGLGLALAAGVPVLAFSIATGGEYWRHTVLYNQNAMHWNELGYWARHLWWVYAPAVLAAIGLGVWVLWRARNRAVREGAGAATAGLSGTGVQALELCGVYLGLNVLSVAALAKAGAAENYLLEPQCALALFCGVGLTALLGEAREAKGEWGAALLAAAVLALLVFHAWRHRPLAEAFFYSAPSPNVQALTQGDRLVRMIRERPGDVLSEDPIYQLRAGRPIVFQNFIMTELAAEGKWDETPVLEQAGRGAFALVIAHKALDDPKAFFNRYTPALREVLAERYHLIARLERNASPNEPFPPLQTIYVYEPSRRE